MFGNKGDKENMVIKNKSKDEWFKDLKKDKQKKVEPMKLAKDALILAGGVVVLGAGAKLLGDLFD